MAQLRRIYDSALVITPTINFIAEVYSGQPYHHVASAVMYCEIDREGERVREGKKKGIRRRRKNLSFVILH